MCILIFTSVVLRVVAKSITDSASSCPAFISSGTNAFNYSVSLVISELLIICIS
nr:MAG TPA: hypothetical protein [Bacteriophage sp.]